MLDCHIVWLYDVDRSEVKFNKVDSIMKENDTV